MNLGDFLGKRICVAVSGGVDSTALMHYLKSREKQDGFSLSAVHCEHGIRGNDSVADEKFVEKLCREWNVPLFVFRENCPEKAVREKCSLETAARAFRYESFERLIVENKTDFIATAHHVSDEAETVLFRLARGTLSGARAMTEQNGYLLRPFLAWTKEKIMAYAKEHALVWHEDYTNFQTEATRNKLRLNVFPALEEAVPGARENLARFARLLAEDDAYLYEEARKLVSRETKTGYLVEFCDTKPLFSRACLIVMKALGIERDYTSLHIESVFALQKAERGARLDLPKNVRAERTEKGVWFYVYEEEEILPLPKETPFDVSGFDGGRYAVNVSFAPPTAEETEWKALRLDGEKIPKNAVFRFRKEGDWINKFGGGTKSLKKLFNEKKTPVKEREFLPLIAEKDGGEVYAVCGVEIADGVKVTEETRSVLYITIRKK